MDNLHIGRHISGQFNEDLERVINNVMHMGGLVEKQLTDALAAVGQSDVELAKQVLSNDYQVNAYEVSIDDECTRVIAKRQPAAGDLRLIMAVVKTIADLEEELISILENGQHLVNPSVSVRLLNAKVTVLGEVRAPGTYNFTEQFISLPQALGYAGDLNINGKRTDVLLIREQAGQRRISQIDLTTTNWMNNPEYRIMPNDVIVVNPNNAKVKSAGIIGNASTVVSFLSVLLSITILLTR